MLSTGEFEFIKGLTIDYFKRDYTNYLCITNNPTNYSNNNVYDVICYYSKDDMTLSNYQLNLKNSTICQFDSNNYSDNNTINKLVCEETSGQVSLDSKEFIYSNLGGFSDIIADYQLQTNKFNELYFGLLVILSILVLTFLYNFTSRILKG